MIVVSDTSAITALLQILARREGLHVIGLMGVALEVKGRGLIPSVHQFTKQLESEARFHVAGAGEL